MSFTLMIVIFILVLFALAFVTKKRFGILGLALFAGSYLAHTWTGTATPFIEKAGVDFSQLGVPVSTLVGITITLLPAFILLINSPKYSEKRARVLGAIGFSVLSVVLLAPMIQSVFLASGTTDALYTFIVTNYSSLVTVGLVAAIIDLFLSHQAKIHRKSHSGEH